MSDILLQGLDIAKLLSSAGPVVKCVLLRATENAAEEESKPAAAATVSLPDNNHKKRVILTDLIDELQVDTTPKKSMVAQILGGPFTFLGQYDDEGIVLMCGKSQEEGPLNPHQLQPPLTDSVVRGDILILKVAPTEEVLDDDDDDDDDDGDHEKAVVVPTNDEFFLDYTKEEYIAFASRTDVVAPEMEEGDDGEEEEEEEEEEEIEEEEDEEYSGEEEEDDDDDEDDLESQVAMMNLIMGQVLRRFHEENGRGPDTRELLELRSALAEKIGVEVPEVQGADWDQKASKRKTEVVDAEVDHKSPLKPILTKKRAVEEDDPGVEEKEEEEQEAKRVKFSEHNETECAADATGSKA
jgi:hypothetical protein